MGRSSYVQTLGQEAGAFPPKSLTLSESALKRLVALQEAMLSPLEHESVEDWCRSVLKLAEHLFSGDRSALVLATSERLRHSSESIDPQYLRAYREQIANVGAGGISYADHKVDRMWRRMRTERIEAWTMEGLARLIGESPEHVAMYIDVVVPSGIAHSYAISVAVPSGEAILGVAHSDPADDPWGEESGLHLSRLLLPAFKAGTASMARFHANRASIGRVGDELAEAFELIGLGGGQMHRTRMLGDLLAADPDRRLLEREIARIAAEVGRIRYAGGRCVASRAGEVEVATGTARYVLRATLVGRGVVGVEDAVLVLVERLTPALPSATSR